MPVLFSLIANYRSAFALPHRVIMFQKSKQSNAMWTSVSVLDLLLY